MLVNLGVPWVILGHSERRALLKESNEVCYRLHLMIVYNFSTKSFTYCFVK
jgi:triosephosphate isomerase